MHAHVSCLPAASLTVLLGCLRRLAPFGRLDSFALSGSPSDTPTCPPTPPPFMTDNMMLETPAAPVLLRPAPPPEPDCLPMLHIDAPHHPLDAEHVQQVG